MEDQHAFNTITLATFNELLAAYPSIIPKTLATLEEQRLHAIPAAIHSRDPHFITKDELATLMDWKVAHGKNRYPLKKLIQQNEGVTIKIASIEAFRLLPTPTSIQDAQKAMTKLSTLRGVGPATASLVISCRDPNNVPFFSDELYRWTTWDSVTGWQKEIKYSEQAYVEMWPSVQELRERLEIEGGEEVSALNVECVAYVLGKRAEAELAEREPWGKKGRKAKGKEGEEVEGGEGGETGVQVKKGRKHKATELDQVKEGESNDGGDAKVRGKKGRKPKAKEPEELEGAEGFEANAASRPVTSRKQSKKAHAPAPETGSGKGKKRKAKEVENGNDAEAEFANKPASSRGRRKKADAPAPPANGQKGRKRKAKEPEGGEAVETEAAGKPTNSRKRTKKAVAPAAVPISGEGTKRKVNFPEPKELG